MMTMTYTKILTTNELSNFQPETAILITFCTDLNRYCRNVFFHIITIIDSNESLKISCGHNQLLHAPHRNCGIYCDIGEKTLLPPCESR